MIGWPDAGQVPDAGAARCWAHSARGLSRQGAFFNFYLFQFYKVTFPQFLFIFSHFLCLRWPRCSPLSSSAISWPVPLRRSNPSELSTGFPWEDSPWHLHSIIQLLALESNQPDSCLPHPRLSSLGKSDSQNCPSSFKGEIAKADFQLFLILDPPRTLVKILYFDNYKQICAQYPPNL